jgi:hypothetical protein
LKDNLPAGYVRVTAGRCTVIAREAHEEDARALLVEGTLYEAAARDLAARQLAGRGVAYAITLPISGRRAVVRHNRHGGLFARVTRDLFLPPTRAPYELEVAIRLIAAKVRTPAVLMYGVERRAALFRRSDVVTQEVPDGRELGDFMMPEVAPAERAAAWEATRVLVRSLNAVGARHHDLNVKNILLSPRRAGGGFDAWALDVDRVTFAPPEAASVRVGNAQRLIRSATKWRDEKGAVLDDREVQRLGTLVAQNR